MEKETEVKREKVSGRFREIEGEGKRERKRKRERERGKERGRQTTGPLKPFKVMVSLLMVCFYTS